MASLLLAEGGILFDLGINPKVVAVQIVIFLTTFFILRRLLFVPVMKFMTEREAEAERAAEKIRFERAEGDRLAKEYELHLARIDKEAWDRLQAILKEAIEARGRMAAEAQQRAAQETRAALEVISKERTAALAALKKDIPAMSRQAVERVLGVPFESGTLESAAKGEGS
jgi:F-type H+-transporting ATPase subunit b